MLSHLRLVVAVSRNYLGYGLPQADLIQEGNVGLMKAVRRFDPERGVRLVSFALHWIRAEMHEYILRNWRLVKVATTKAQRKLFFNLRSMKASTSALTVAEAKASRRTWASSPRKSSRWRRAFPGATWRIDPTPERRGEQRLADRLPDGQRGRARADPRAQGDRAEPLARACSTALAKLDDRSRRIIEARWLREDDDASTLQELADEYGVSAERIRQIESKAMKTMRMQMAHAG